MKTFTVALFFSALALAAGARVFSVREFGAKGDGVTKDTAAVQSAIDAAAAAGGGTVELDAGTYLSGTVWLKNNVDFHLAAGATLKGSPDPKDYCAADCVPQNWASGPNGDNHQGGHLVCCVGRRNVTLRGPGRINGNAPAFIRLPDGSHPPTKRDIAWRPAQMIWFCDSSGIRVTDLDIYDAPYWSCFLLNCDRVQIRGCRVFTRRQPRHTYNGDGIDIDRCRYVTVSDCVIDTSDDSITLRASCGKRLADPHDCCHISIANCVLSSECNAVRFGVGEGKVHHVALSNLVIRDTRNAFNFVGAYSKGNRGTDITDIRVSNVVLDAERFVHFYPRFATEVEFRDIAFSGISGQVRKPSIIRSVPGKPTKGLVFRDFRLPRDFDIDDTEIVFE